MTYLIFPSAFFFPFLFRAVLNHVMSRVKGSVLKLKHLFFSVLQVSQKTNQVSREQLPSSVPLPTLCQAAI